MTGFNHQIEIAEQETTGIHALNPAIAALNDLLEYQLRLNLNSNQKEFGIENNQQSLDSLSESISHSFKELIDKSSKFNSVIKQLIKQ